MADTPSTDRDQWARSIRESERANVLGVVRMILGSEVFDGRYCNDAADDVIADVSDFFGRIAQAVNG